MTSAEGTHGDIQAAALVEQHRRSHAPSMHDQRRRRRSVTSERYVMGEGLASLSGFSSTLTPPKLHTFRTVGGIVVLRAWIIIHLHKVGRTIPVDDAGTSALVSAYSGVSGAASPVKPATSTVWPRPNRPEQGDSARDRNKPFRVAAHIANRRLAIPASARGTAPPYSDDIPARYRVALFRQPCIQTVGNWRIRRKAAHA